MRFTDKGIQALKKAQSAVRGGRGRRHRLSRSRLDQGRRTFSYLYRFGGKPRRMTLGVYRDRTGLDAEQAAATHDARGLPYLTLADAEDQAGGGEEEAGWRHRPGRRGGPGAQGRAQGAERRRPDRQLPGKICQAQ